MPPSATPEQLEAMVSDSAAPILFLDAANAEAVAGRAFAARRIAIEALDDWLADGPPAPVTLSDAELISLPFNIIYSSGTTGTPKGIVHIDENGVTRGDPELAAHCCRDHELTAVHDLDPLCFHLHQTR